MNTTNQNVCPRCNGEGEAVIPPGTRNYPVVCPDCLGTGKTKPANESVIDLKPCPSMNPSSDNLSDEAKAAVKWIFSYDASDRTIEECRFYIKVRWGDAVVQELKEWSGILNE